MHGRPPPSTTWSQPKTPLPPVSPSIAMSSISAFNSSMSVAASSSFTSVPPAASFCFLFSSFFFSFVLLFLSCSDESWTPHARSRRHVARRGEWRGVGGGLEEAEELEVEVEVELEAELELEHGLPAAGPVDIGDTVHKSFIKAVHNSPVHKSVHNSLLTAVSVL